MKLEDVASIDNTFKKNISRFTQASIKVLKELELLETKKIGQSFYISITQKGIELLEKTPKNLVTTNSRLGNKSLTPLIGFIFNEFRKHSLPDKNNEINRKIFEDKITDYFDVTKNELNDIFSTIKTEMTLSPILLLPKI